MHLSVGTVAHGGRSMNIDHYKQRLLKLEREIGLRLGTERAETARGRDR